MRRQRVGGVGVGHRHGTQAGGAGRLQSPPRVLDGDGSPGIEAPPGRGLDPGERFQVRIGRGLRLGGLIGADDRLEQVAEPGVAQHVLDLVGQRPRRDRQRHRFGGSPDELGGAGKEHFAFAGQGLVTPALGRDEAGQRVVGQGAAGVGGDRAEHADVVEAKVAVVVRLVGDRHRGAGQHVLIGAQVQALAVGDHPVEVEDDRVQRPHRVGASVAFGGRRSPARIGVFSRFSVGGNGQSYSAL